MIMYDRSELESYLKEFHAECEESLGETGRALSCRLHKLVDLILTEQDERIKERIKEQARAQVVALLKELVVPWALQDSDEKIPVSKFDKEGIMLAVRAPDFMDDGERLEFIQTLIEDVKKRGVMGDR